MPTVFKQAISTEIGTVPVDVLDIPGGVRATVIGCNLANVTEYDTVTVNGTLSLSYDYYILNKATALAITLPSGGQIGETKVFTNKGAGVATVTANLAGASVSFALAQNEGCQTIWDGTEWFLIGNQSVVTLA